MKTYVGKGYSIRGCPRCSPDGVSRPGPGCPKCGGRGRIKTVPLSRVLHDRGPVLRVAMNVYWQAKNFYACLFEVDRGHRLRTLRIEAALLRRWWRERIFGWDQ